MSTPTFQALFCEDIRQENNGKYMILGVYASDMNLPSVPIKMSLGVFVRVSNLPKGPHKFSIDISSPGGQQGVEISGEADLVRDDRAMVLAFGGFPMEMSRPGDLVAKITWNGEEPIEIARLPVQVSEA